jgi:hypothetical protein
MNKIRIASLVLSLLLAGCGTKSLGPTGPKKLTPKDSPQTGAGCPATAPDDQHVVSMTFSRGAPVKLGLKLPGDADFRVSECATRSQTGVIASLGRGANGTVVITVKHNGFYTQGGVTTLPADQSFELFDLHGCDTSAPTSFYKTVQPVPLTWRYDFPNGATCAGRVVGSYNGTVTL